ncbi:uncharacterized protein LOC144908268 [Branchiostoma floridae x Branchiostoma belcheri]
MVNEMQTSRKFPRRCGTQRRWLLWACRSLPSDGRRRAFHVPKSLARKAWPPEICCYFPKFLELLRRKMAEVTPRKKCEEIILSGIPTNVCANCGRNFDETTSKKRRNMFGPDATLSSAGFTTIQGIENLTGVNIVAQECQPAVFVCSDCFTIIKSYAAADKRCVEARRKFHDHGKSGFFALRKKRVRSTTSTPRTPGKVAKRRRQLFSPGTTPRKSTSPPTLKVSVENKIRKVGPKITSIVKPLLDYKYSRVANAVCKHEKIKPFILANVLSVVNKEAQGICKPSQPSILRSPSLKNLTVSNITKEMEDRAPTITRVLRVISSPVNETVRTRKSTIKLGRKKHLQPRTKRKVTINQQQEQRKKQDARRQPIIATSVAAFVSCQE